MYGLPGHSNIVTDCLYPTPLSQYDPSSSSSLTPALSPQEHHSQGKRKKKTDMRKKRKGSHRKTPRNEELADEELEERLQNTSLGMRIVPWFDKEILLNKIKRHLYFLELVDAIFYCHSL